MTDAETVNAFERGDVAEFHHADHVRVAYAYVRTMPLLDALARFSAALRRFATAKGQPQLYHETITWAFLLLIHERVARGNEATWEDFAARNADLLRWKPSVLDAYYTPEVLASDLARRTFVLPSRGL